MRVFTLRDFARRARKSGLTDQDLLVAVSRAQAGLIDARYRAGLIKQRIGRINEGRSGGFRSILWLETSRAAVFLHLFAKSAQSNVSAVELDGLIRLAKLIARMTTEDIDAALASKEWIEISTGSGSGSALPE